jgi:thioredoxin reductase
MIYDVVIVGGGPAGLSAALTLGRGRRRVMVCDAGPRGDGTSPVQNFITRDGTTPEEFRSIARAQLEPYTSVDVRDTRVDSIGGSRGAFDVHLGDGTTAIARRILLCTGMIDQLPELEGFRELWGTSIFPCPYCHGWEVRDQSFGVLASSVSQLDFALLLRGWTNQVVALTNGDFTVPGEVVTRLSRAGVRLEQRRIARLVTRNSRLDSVELVGSGAPVPVQVLFARPPHRQVPLVAALDLTLTPEGYVLVDEHYRGTSMPGVYAGGELTSSAQSAVIAAGSAVMAAAMLNHTLMIERAGAGDLP